MFDARIRPLIDPPLNRAGNRLARCGVSANTLTLAGAFLALLAGIAIALGAFGIGLLLVIANRLLDGLDGAVARATRPTDFGGYLDAVGDFVFYASVPVGFAVADADNAVAATVLLGSFLLTGTSFLGFAILAGKRGLETTAHGRKSFFYSTGLAEGGETVLFFVLMCLFPAVFAELASVFSLLCVLTVVQRTALARITFPD